LLTEAIVGHSCYGSLDAALTAMFLQIEFDNSVARKLNERDTGLVAADVESTHDVSDERLYFIEVGASDASRAVDYEDDVRLR